MSSHLRVNPSHRRFVVCEELVGPRAFRDALLDVLFSTLRAASVALVPASLVALYATPHHTALVVDCGWSEARVLPVFKGMPMQHHYASASTSLCLVDRLKRQNDSPLAGLSAGR